MAEQIAASASKEAAKRRYKKPLIKTTYTVLTPEQMKAQWYQATARFFSLTHTLVYNAAVITRDVFVESFKMKRFQTEGSMPWTPRKRTGVREGSTRQHPLLVETGAMRDSIKFSSSVINLNSKTRTMGITTKPHLYKTRSKRNPNGIIYAGIHNQGIGNIPQRQFMGYSTVAFERINNKIEQLFSNFIK